jgi:hypothetical protein
VPSTTEAAVLALVYAFRIDYSPAQTETVKDAE